MPDDQLTPTLPPAPTLPPRDACKAPLAHQAHSSAPTLQPPVAFTPPPRRRSRRGLWAVALLLAVAGGAFLVFGTTGEDETLSATSAEPSDAATPSAPSPGVGATQTAAGFEVTLVQAVDPWIPSNDIEQAAEGRRLVAVELSIVNATGATEILTSQMMTKLVYGDGSTANFAFPGIDLTPLDGPVDAGGQRQGWTVFDLPADATGLTLEVRGSVLSPPAVFTL